MVARRGYKGGARKTTIVGDISNAVTTITAADLSTWAGATSNGAATATINGGFSDEETITFTGISGNNLTGVTRGQAGTSAQAHSSGATIEHTSSVTDFDDANAHIADTTRDDHTQYAKKSLWSAKGTILAASGAGVPVALAVGTDGQAIIADSASSGGLKYASVATLLGRVQYAPASPSTYTCHATTLGALDTTNLRLTFTIPASGTVVVKMWGFVINASTTGLHTYAGILASSTPIGYLMGVDGGVAASSHSFAVEQLITGLTPGSATWDAASATQGSATFEACGSTSAGASAGPFKMEVWTA